MKAEGKLTIRLLGTVTVQAADGRDVTPPGKKLRALLACLALSSDGWGRERLASLLWGNRDEEQARASLRQALAELRKLFGNPTHLKADREKVELDTTAATIDVAEFERLAAAGAFEAAAALYKGDLLDGQSFSESEVVAWIAIERMRLRDLAIDVLAKLAHAQAGEAAISTAQRMVDIDPLREESHRFLMQLYAASGHRNRALRQYETCRDILKVELGVGPEEEIENLRRSIAAISIHRATAEVIEYDKISIAILPFENLSDDPEQTYFSDGMAEDIIIELGRFKELRVIGRNSSFRMRDSAIDIKDVAQRLGVGFVVVGSVRKTNTRLRMAVKLIDALSMAQVWADRWDRDLSDIFDIQDEVARMVVTKIAGHAKSAMAHRVRSRPTESLSAYDNFLRARECFGMYESMLKAEPFLVRTVGLDPGFAAAHAMISNLSSIKYLCSGQRTHLDHAMKAGQVALNLDPEEPWANHAFGYALAYMRRLDQGKYYLDRAVALNPNDVYILAIHALLMNFMGRAEIALAEIGDALKRDPYAHDWFWEIRGSIQTAAGAYSDALASFGHLSCLPVWTHCYLSMCYAELGRTAEAHECLRALRTLEVTRTPLEVFSVEPYEDATASRLLKILGRVAASAKQPEVR